jgi:hypothetical protein
VLLHEVVFHETEVGRRHNEETNKLFAVQRIDSCYCYAAGSVHADFFKYKDNDGNLIITNRFEDVSQKYRNRVKVVWDKNLAAKDPVARRSAVAMEQYEQQEAAKKAKQETADKKN